MTCSGIQAPGSATSPSNKERTSPLAPAAAASACALPTRRSPSAQPGWRRRREHPAARQASARPPPSRRRSEARRREARPGRARPSRRGLRHRAARARAHRRIGAKRCTASSSFPLFVRTPASSPERTGTWRPSPQARATMVALIAGRHRSQSAVPPRAHAPRSDDQACHADREVLRSTSARS